MRHGSSRQVWGLGFHCPIPLQGSLCRTECLMHSGLWFESCNKKEDVWG